jgi:hemoglobin-like flavoprotein
MSLDIQVIRDSFAQAAPIADQVADKFYEFLFSDYPAAKPLFENVNMANQKKQLMAGLSRTVELLDRPEELTKYLKASGQRHVKYGTKEEHYPLVGNTLIKTFAHFFGDAWTPELQQQWLWAYEFIANTMIQGAKEFTPTSGDITSKIQTVCHKLIEEQLETIIDDTIKAKIKERVRQEIYQAIDEEFQALHLKKVA